MNPPICPIPRLNQPNRSRRQENGAAPPGRSNSQISVACIALATKNIALPISSIMKNSGQGAVRWISQADSASQIATAFQTIAATQTPSPRRAAISQATTSPVSPTTASPTNGISHTAGGSPGPPPPAR